MNTSINQNPANVAGKKVALGIIAMQSKNDTFKAKAMLTLADKYASQGIDIIKQVLNGFEMGYLESGAVAGSAKQRKTELKCVIEAVTNTLVTGDNSKQLANSLDLNYHDFITLSRTLRDKTKEKKEASTSNRKVVLTASQQDTIETGIEKASANQLAEIATHSIVTLHKNVQANLAGFKSLVLIQAICTQLLSNEAIEPIFKNAAQEIDNITAGVIKQAREAAEMASNAGKKAVSVETLVETVGEATL